MSASNPANPGDYRRLSIPVEGGGLTVGCWGPEDGQIVVAVHGITSNHLAMASIAAALPEYRVVAPDLRGRGESRNLPGPYGMARHAADVAALIDAVGGGPVVVAGHSMGGFVVAELARTRPELVAGLVLIDGGLPLQLPPGMDVATAVTASLGPALQRLGMTFPSRAAYLDFWRPHPALRADWSPMIETYLDYDLVGEAPELHSSVSADAVSQDSAELFDRPPGDDVLAGYSGPARLLLVDKGLLGVEPGLYSPSEQAYWRAQLPEVMVESVPDLNHYTLVTSRVGAERIAAAVRGVMG